MKKKTLKRILAILCAVTMLPLGSFMGGVSDVKAETGAATSLNRITLSDMGVADTIDAETNTKLDTTIANAGLSSWDGVMLSMYVKMTDSEAGRIKLGNTTHNSSTGKKDYNGLTIQITSNKMYVLDSKGYISGNTNDAGTATDLNLYMKGTTKYNTSSNLGVGSTFNQTQFLLQVSIEYVDNDEGGERNDIKLGVYVNGKLIQDKYEYINNPVQELGLAVSADSNVTYASCYENDYYDIEQYRKDLTVGTYKSPVRDGYVFAGWYTDDDFEQQDALDSAITTGKAYAKFVDKDVLGVRRQLRKSATAGGYTDLRFVTSVDSMNYNYVGFKITVDGTEKGTYTTREVYEKINGYTYVDAETNVVSYLPWEEFSTKSTHFMALTLTGVPSTDFEKTIEVTPIWRTMDGTVVSGAADSKAIVDYQNYQDYVSE